MDAPAHTGPAPTRAEFDQAISASGGAWYAACLRITRDPARAEDAVQEALLSAWAKRRQYSASARLTTWIHRIAVNCALGQLRRNSRVEWLPLDDEPAGAGPGPAELAAAYGFRRELAAALGGLSDLERTCFVLKHVEQWQLKEIAKALETNVGPVKQALFRALGKLRGALAAQRGEE